MSAQTINYEEKACVRAHQMSSVHVHTRTHNRERTCMIEQQPVLPSSSSPLRRVCFRGEIGCKCFLRFPSSYPLLFIYTQPPTPLAYSHGEFYWLKASFRLDMPAHAHTHTLLGKFNALSMCLITWQRIIWVSADDTI